MELDLRLDRLELANFHKFEHCSIDLDERLTVLVGDNGSGKSSLLEAAAIALDSVISHLVFMHQRVIETSDARIALFDMGDVVERQPQFPVIVSACGRVEETKLGWSQTLQSMDGGSREDAEQSYLQLLRSCSASIQGGEANLVLPVLAYYGTGRLWSEGRGSIDVRRRTFSRQNGYLGSLEANASSDQMLSWFFKMTAQDVQRAQSLKPTGESGLFAAVRGAVERCFQGITGCKRVNVTYNLDADDLDVEYADECGEVQRMSMGLLSDGYRTVLSMVADIAYRMALLNPALGGDAIEKTSGVVLIDEIDLHLHPLWQARILGDLRDIFPRVQFVVTTHAPVVISSVRASHVRLLGDGDEVRRPSTEVYGGEVGRMLVSVMGAPERPVLVQARFDEFYQALDEGNLDAARSLLNGLEADLGADDTGVVSARTALSLEEVDARYAAD